MWSALPHMQLEPLTETARRSERLLWHTCAQPQVCASMSECAQHDPLLVRTFEFLPFGVGTLRRLRCPPHVGG